MPRALALALALVLLAAPLLARAQCEVIGVASIERLRVRVPGERLRTLSIHDLPVAVRPGRGNTYRDVRVLAPLSFAARTDAPIPWTVPRPGSVADGMVFWTPSVDVEDVREEDPDRIAVRVEVEDGVWISRLEVPCGALGVGLGEGGDDAPDWGAARGPEWLPRRPRLWLSSAPGSGARLRLEAPRGLAAPLVEVEREGAWVRLVARFSSGAAVRGWARVQDLASGGEARDAPPFRRSLPTTTASACARRPPARNEYVGPARVASGAIVRTEPEGEPWAAVSEPAVLTVSWVTGSEWARIVHVPGLRSDGNCPEVIGRSWLPRQAISLQGEGSARGDAAPASLLGIE